MTCSGTCPEAIVAVLASRVLLASIVIRSQTWRLAVVFAGMRGGLSLALALALPDHLPDREEIIDAVFAVVLFTLIIQGIALEPLLQRLGFADSITRRFALAAFGRSIGAMAGFSLWSPSTIATTLIGRSADLLSCRHRALVM